MESPSVSEVLDLLNKKESPKWIYWMFFKELGYEIKLKALEKYIQPIDISGILS